MDSTERFSNRVENYVKYRPHYPAAIIGFLQQQYGLSADKQVADIGAGTGISSELFLNAGYRVTAVEPNKEMREQAVTLLGHHPGFSAADGTAEHTGLGTGSVDVIVAGQAFHWFDAVAAKTEFTRLLKPDGIVVLMWNERQAENDFEATYDWLIVEYGKDYVQVKHRNIDMQDIAAFFSPQPCMLRTFDHRQEFNFEGLKGRLLSSSYMPVAGEDGFDEMIVALRQVFDRYAENGVVQVRYITKVYAGRFLRAPGV